MSDSVWYLFQLLESSLQMVFGEFSSAGASPPVDCRAGAIPFRHGIGCSPLEITPSITSHSCRHQGPCLQAEGLDASVVHSLAATWNADVM